jgi:hypothetical protein
VHEPPLLFEQLDDAALYALDLEHLGVEPLVDLDSKVPIGERLLVLRALFEYRKEETSVSKK